jgi:hypothetical protein
MTSRWVARVMGNDQNLWIGPQQGDAKGRTFPRMI